MDHLKTAYDLGAQLARIEFAKQAEPALGDPAFWQGGEQTQQQPPQPATAEEAAMSLPTGTFQGLTTRLSPEGERSTSVKVTPDALGVPDNLAAIFQAEPTAKVEVAQPQVKAEGANQAQADLGIPSNLPGSPPPDPLTQPKVAGLPFGPLPTSKANQVGPQDPVAIHAREGVGHPLGHTDTHMFPTNPQSTPQGTQYQTTLRRQFNEGGPGSTQNIMGTQSVTVPRNNKPDMDPAWGRETVVQK